MRQNAHLQGEFQFKKQAAGAVRRCPSPLFKMRGNSGDLLLKSPLLDVEHFIIPSRKLPNEGPPIG